VVYRAWDRVVPFDAFFLLCETAVSFPNPIVRVAVRVL
jgi:hypothetical protein